uniref:Uncharacterized protein n=1 Tax=Rousettus aegyptiacus TaxID=9407 RepID=A0A7J8FJV6_ROUAE|nr:hypothetical protein HJG63_011893 [Rousettus aegyptiacus]
MSFQINFYLLRPVASDGDKITRENVAMEVTTPLQILQDDSSAPSSVGIFLRAGQRWLWVLSVTQIPYRPKGGVVPTLSCSRTPFCQLQNTELNRRDDPEDRFEAGHFLPQPSLSYRKSPGSQRKMPHL